MVHLLHRLHGADAPVNNDNYICVISNWIRSLLVRKKSNQPNYIFLCLVTLRNKQLALAVDSSIQICGQRLTAKICTAFHDKLLLFDLRLWRDDDFLADLLHNVRTCNFYRTTLFASAVCAMTLCMSVCVCSVTSGRSTKRLNIWLHRPTCKSRPVCDVHRFSFVGDFTFCCKRFTCKRDQCRHMDHRHTKMNVYNCIFIYLPKCSVQYSQ